MSGDPVAGGAPAGDGAGEAKPAAAGRLQRALGVPGLFAAAYSAVGFSIYFALGVVAERGLGLTPLIFLASGLLFGLTTLTYVEGSAMFRERGGSSSFARHAFNELIAFVAGWAILLDYLIVLALAAISVPHYLEPIWGGFAENGAEIAVAAAVIAAVCVLNILNVSGRGGQRSLALLALADLALQLAVIVVGLLVVMHPDRLTAQLDLFSQPSVRDIIYAAVIAMLAYAGIEAASDLAPDIEVSRRDLKRVATLGAFAVPLVYAGMAAIALMAVPVVAGPNGPETALGGEFIEEPVLGVVSAFHPHWVAETMRWAVTLVAVPVLFWAANTTMLGVSRHTYTLAINRQIPSWLGKLDRRNATPYVAITICGLIALGLVIPTDVKLLAGIYAFGATLAITIAHLSIIRLRVKARTGRARSGSPRDALGAGGAADAGADRRCSQRPRVRQRPRLPPDRALGRDRLDGLRPRLLRRLPQGLRGDDADQAGLGHRAGADQAGARGRVPQHPRAGLRHQARRRHRRHRRPAGGREEAESGGEAGEARLDVIYVIEVPLTLPLDAELPKEREEVARRALERAREVGEEYEDVEVSTEVIRARKVGAGIVEAARRTGAEAIVIGGEPPTKIRGGAKIGGIGAAKPAEIGAATEYVLKKAPCRVLLTAPPEAVEPELAAEKAATAETS